MTEPRNEHEAEAVSFSIGLLLDAVQESSPGSDVKSALFIARQALAINTREL
jgi:hypothetical protein